MPESDIKDRLLDAALAHVPFEGWSEASFRAAARDAGVDEALARAAYPRAALDMALAYHARGDALMRAALAGRDLSEMRFRDRIALAVRLRIEAVSDREAVRRGSVLFSLPQHAPEGAAAIWGTADAIWTALGDTSRDVNWYSKRATLSAVYAATVLYWLGDDSPDHAATWEFLDRRIDDVMQIEKLKAGVRDNAALSRLLSGPLSLLGRIRAPEGGGRAGMPGRWPPR